jgi:hypothetical protein
MVEIIYFVQDFTKDEPDMIVPTAQHEYFFPAARLYKF